jgi:hypothetical protein
VESSWVHSALRPLISLLCHPRVITMMVKSVEWWLARETEVLRENLPQYHFVHHKPYMLYPDTNPGIRGGKPAANRLSHGTAKKPSWKLLKDRNITLLRKYYERKKKGFQCQIYGINDYPMKHENNPNQRCPSSGRMCLCAGRIIKNVFSNYNNIDTHPAMISCMKQKQKKKNNATPRNENMSLIYVLILRTKVRTIKWIYIRSLSHTNSIFY